LPIYSWDDFGGSSVFRPIPTHRLISLFYLAWEKHISRLPISGSLNHSFTERRFHSRTCFDLIGMGTPGLQERLSLPNSALLATAADCGHSARISLSMSRGGASCATTFACQSKLTSSWANGVNWRMTNSRTLTRMPVSSELGSGANRGLRCGRAGSFFASGLGPHLGTIQQVSCGRLRIPRLGGSYQILANRKR